MSQRLTIHQFGPISDIKIDIDDIIVFIGSQASGKSTVSKAIFFFKSLRDDLYRYYYDCYHQNKFDANISNFGKLAKQKFIKIYGSVLQSPNMKLTYTYGEKIVATVKPSDDNRFTDIEFSPIFRKKFNQTMNKIKNSYDELHRKNSSFSSYREVSTLKAKEANLFAEIDADLNTLFGDDRDIVFLPAGRSLITTLSQQRYNIDMGDDWSSNSEIELLGVLYIDLVNRCTIKPLHRENPEKCIQILRVRNNSSVTAVTG